MAISVTNANRGTATEKVSDNSLTLTPSGTLATGSYGIAVIVFDNITAADGASTDAGTLTDTQSHTWTLDRGHRKGAAGALTGVDIAVFSAKLTNGLTTSDTLTWTLSGNSTAKGAGLAEVAVGAGNTLVSSGVNGNAGAASTSYTITLGSLSNISHLWIGAPGAEEELGTAVTLDTAYTALFGGTIGSGTGGANATNVIAAPGYLIETSTTQTFDNSGLTSCDRATVLCAYEEQTAATTSLPLRANSTMRQLIRR